MGSWQTFILGLCEHLAWPVTVILCVFIFKKDVRKILPRLTKLPGGTELYPEAPEEQEEDKLNYDETLKKTEEKKEVEQIQGKEAK